MAITTETKVGAFFLFGLIVLSVFTFKVADLGALFHREMIMTARFPHVSGLKQGDGVHMAGVKVGEIEKLQLHDNFIEVVMAIDRKVRIRESSVATVAWGGLIGNRYVDISFGNPEDPTLPPGSNIRIGPSVELGAVLRKVDLAAAAFREMMESANIGPRLSEVIDNLLAITADIKEQRGTIGKFIGSDEAYNKVMSVADNLQDVSVRASKILEENDARISSILEGLDTAIPEARDAFASIKRVGEEIEDGKGLLPGLIRDEQMYQDFKDALSSLKVSLEKVEGVASSFQEGKGLMARLANDEQLADDFGETVKSAKAIAQRLETGDSTLARLSRDSELYDDLKKLLDDARETLRSAKDQIPVGTFVSVMLSAF